MPGSMDARGGHLIVPLLLSVPLIGVGKIPTPDLNGQALQDGDCDLVGM
jgi:2,4-dienoyl-CoA reductase-like NADH-dependent reductase (Old Yellow Enzyme family)